jgi:hypothetical protein
MDVNSWNFPGEAEKEHEKGRKFLEFSWRG